jgi:leucyl aminopeptidase
LITQANQFAQILFQTAQALAKEFGLDCVVLEESDMSALGMGSLLSVSKGSIESPKLISLSYQGKGNAKPIVLVGKGELLIAVGFL